MRIDTQNHGAVTVLKPQGALHEEEADEFLLKFTEVSTKSHGRVVIDIAAIPFTDSRGLEVLLQASEQLEQTGQTLRMCGQNETLREIFELTEMAHRFDHYADATSAARSFR